MFGRAFLLHYDSFAQIVKYGPEVLVFRNALAVICGKEFILSPPILVCEYDSASSFMLIEISHFDTRLGF